MILTALLTYQLPHGAAAAAAADGGIGNSAAAAAAAAAGGMDDDGGGLGETRMQTVRVIAAYWLGSAGCLYFIMGFLCFRRLKDRQLRRIAERQQIRHNINELFSQKQEIERLMKETEHKLDRL